MLGEIVAGMPARSRGSVSGAGASGAGAEGTPRLAARSVRLGSRLHDVSFDLRAGEVLGVVALEGQGQDELFDVLAGLAAPRRRGPERRREAGRVPPPGRCHPGRPRVRGR